MGIAATEETQIQRLEQELAQAREEIENLKASGIHSCGDHCKRPLCLANREIKAMKEAIEMAHTAMLRYDIEDSILEEGEEATLSVTAQDQKELRFAIRCLRPFTPCGQRTPPLMGMQTAIDKAYKILAYYRHSVPSTLEMSEMTWLKTTEGRETVDALNHLIPFVHDR